MKKYTFIILCLILILSSVILLYTNHKLTKTDFQNLDCVLIRRTNDRVMHSYSGYMRIIDNPFSRYIYIKIVTDGVMTTLQVKKSDIYLIVDAKRSENE